MKKKRFRIIVQDNDIYPKKIIEFYADQIQYSIENETYNYTKGDSKLRTATADSILTLKALYDAGEERIITRYKGE